MEFFKSISLKSTEEEIQKSFTLDNLPLMTNQLFIIGEQNILHAEIGSLWGEFTLARQEIKGGVRFSLVECPNALTWTITCGVGSLKDSVVIHLTINRIQVPEDFLEEINFFLADLTECVNSFFLEED